MLPYTSPELQVFRSRIAGISSSELQRLFASIVLDRIVWMTRCSERLLANSQMLLWENSGRGNFQDIDSVLINDGNEQESETMKARIRNTENEIRPFTELKQHHYLYFFLHVQSLTSLQIR